MKYVYVNAESKEGKDIRANISSEITSVPAIIPVEKGGRVIKNISFNGQEYNFPNTEQLVSAKPGVTKVTKADQVQVNSEIFQTLEDGVWLND